MFKYLCVCDLILCEFAPNCDYFIYKMCTCYVCYLFERCYNSVVMYDAPWWCFSGSVSKFFYCSPEFVHITNLWFNTSAVSVNCVVI